MRRQWTGPLVAFAFGLLAIHRRLLQSIPWEAQLCSGHDLVVRQEVALGR